MTRDEAKKLLSGYATGALTEAEQRALFAAALEDQELFDELAEEQTLKELIELPGARERLVAALEPAQPKKQFVWWPWAAGVAASAVLAVWLLTPRVEQVKRTVADVRQSRIELPAPQPQSEPAPAPAVSQPEPRRAVKQAPTVEPRQFDKNAIVSSEEKKEVVGAIAPPPPPPPPAAPV